MIRLFLTLDGVAEGHVSKAAVAVFLEKHAT